MKLKNLSDQLLLEKSRLGDEKAFKELFTRYFRPLLVVAKKYLKQEIIAEELVMDLMLWIWNKRFDLEIEGSFEAYLYKAIRNKIISYLRKSVPNLVELDDFYNETLAGNQRTDSNLLYEETYNLYNKKLKELSYQRRQAFILSREHNKTYSEIGMELNISVNTVKSHIKYSLKYFRDNMANHLNDHLIWLLILYMVYSLN